MNESVTIVVSNREEAHRAAVQLYETVLKPATEQGVVMELTAKEFEDDRSLKQNRFYWGPCLREIADQARVGGIQYTPEAWHELFKRMFLGYDIDKVRVAGKKRTHIIRHLKSTTKLTVRQMSNYLDKLQAYAAAELGVQFSVLRWEDFDATKWGRH